MMKSLLALTLIIPATLFCADRDIKLGEQRLQQQAGPLVPEHPRFPEVDRLRKWLDINKFLQQFHEPQSTDDILYYLEDHGVDYKVHIHLLMGEIRRLGIVEAIPDPQAPGGAGYQAIIQQ